MRIYFFICFLLYTSMTLTQERDGCRPEIWTSTYNVPSGSMPVTFTFSKFLLGTVFCRNWYTNNYYICTTTDDPCTTTVLYNQLETAYGITICIDDFYNNCVEDNYGFTVYKVSCSATDKYFYINFLDTQYGRPGGYFVDMKIKFDYSNGGSFSWTKANPENWISIANKEILNIWSMFDYNEPFTSDFPNFWNNSLFCDENENNPILFWGKYPTAELGTITKYNIYRNINGTDLWIGTTTSSNFSFVDYSYVKDWQYDEIHYKIKAVNGSGVSSSFSNSAIFAGYMRWDYALLLTNNSSNPRLAWGPYPGPGTATGYKVYRKVNNGSFTQIGGDLSASTYQYTDYDYSIVHHNGNTLEYYVKAILSGGSLSSATNTINTSGINQNKEIADYRVNSLNFELSANYPNPFNPLTTIDYQINDLSFVDLRVFNSMGEEVAVLVNEYKSPGKYTVNFDGSNLSSSIYFYKLQSGGNTIVKNMVLMK